MQIQQRVLRLAAAASVTVVLVGGAMGPVYAASSDGTTHQSDQSTSAKSKADHSDGNASTTGDSTEPQPESTADQNDGGANAGDCDSTTTDSPESTDSTEGTDSSESADSSDSADSTDSTDTQDSTEASDSTESTDTNNYCSTRDGSPSMNGEGDGQATGKPCAGCVGKADNKNPKGQYPDGSDANNGYECDGNNGIGKSNPAHTGCTSGAVSPDGSEPGQSCPPDSEECPTTTEDSPGEVLGVQAERDPGANRPAAEVAPASSGLLPETGAGRYGIPIVAGLALLGAGAALVARKRPQTGR